MLFGGACLSTVRNEGVFDTDGDGCVKAGTDYAMHQHEGPACALCLRYINRNLEMRRGTNYN